MSDYPIIMGWGSDGVGGVHAQAEGRGLARAQLEDGKRFRGLARVHAVEGLTMSVGRV